MKIYDKLYMNNRNAHRYNHINKLIYKDESKKDNQTKNLNNNIDNLKKLNLEKNNDIDLEKIIVKQKKITIKEYINWKKNILMTKMNIEKLENNKQKLDTIIRNGEKTFKIKEDDLKVNDKYFEQKYDELKKNITEINNELTINKNEKKKLENNLKLLKSNRTSNMNLVKKLNEKLSKLKEYKNFCNKMFGLSSNKIDIASLSNLKLNNNYKTFYITENIENNKENDLKYVNYFIETLKNLEEDNLNLIIRIQSLEEEYNLLNFKIKKIKDNHKKKKQEILEDLTGLDLKIKELVDSLEIKQNFLTSQKELKYNNENDINNEEDLKIFINQTSKKFSINFKDINNSSFYDIIKDIEKNFENKYYQIKKLNKKYKYQFANYIKTNQGNLKVNKGPETNLKIIEQRETIWKKVNSKHNKVIEKNNRKMMVKKFLKNKVIIKNNDKVDEKKIEEELYFLIKP